MRILTAAQIRSADEHTIANEPVSSLELMERAAKSCYQWLSAHFRKDIKFIIFCGSGNNGGDGLVIARLLKENGYDVSVFIIKGSTSTPDFIANNIKYKNAVEFHTVDDFPEVGKDDVIIDALFGTGLSRPLTGLAEEIVKLINRTNTVVVSIDVASGLMADKDSGPGENAIVKATYTLSFETYKPAFLFSEYSIYTGKIIVLPIGLSKEYIESIIQPYFFTEKEDVRKIIKPRGSFSHKGDYGHTLIIAGSLGKMGAAVMAVNSCLRTGAGLVTACIPGCGHDIMQVSVPEAMVICDEEYEHLSKTPSIENYQAVGIGPGIGKNPATAAMLKMIIQNLVQPVVFDADAINILAENKTWMEFLPAESILTPHPKEFERIAGKYRNGFERLEKQLELSSKHNIYIVLKGKNTCITTPGGICYFNTTGNPGMAKGGSGDVLTGMIAGLLSQGYTPLEAARAGVFMHGLAADIAVEKCGEFSLLASDIINSIGKAYLNILDGAEE